MRPRPSPLYAHFARAYELLATELGVAVEIAYRELWLQAPGKVRSGFVAAVGRMPQSKWRRALGANEKAALQQAADTIFATGARPQQDATIIEIWRRTLHSRKRRSSPD